MSATLLPTLSLGGVARRLDALERSTADLGGPAAGERPKAHPLLDARGRPIGMGGYSRLVTPQWRWDWPHLRCIDRVLDEVTGGGLRLVILEIPPRHGKTEKVTVRYAAYRLELDPTLPVILGAYNGKTAQKSSRKIRRLAAGRLALSRERNSASDWETAEGGGVRAAGVGEGIAGLPAKLILLDDPFGKKEDADNLAFREKVWEWWLEDVSTRLEPGGAVVLTMNRRHEDDLVGRILASEEGPDWSVIRLPALAEDDDPLGRPEGAALCPDRYDEEALAKIRRRLGERRFACLYQQRPAPASGHVFKTEHLRYYTTRDRPIPGVPFLPDRSPSGSRRTSASRRCTRCRRR
ncbi:MAG: terminase large subunit domain-containing protein [Gemmatimonadaceae bacterium]